MESTTGTAAEATRVSASANETGAAGEASGATAESVFELGLQLMEMANRHMQEEVPAKLESLIRETLGPDGPEVSLSECHVIMCIGDGTARTAIQIAQALGMTRGGVSKILARLETKGLVTASKSAEVRGTLLTLTPTGQLVHGIHDRMHQENRRHWIQLFESWSDQELELMSRILAKVMERAEEESAG